MVTAEGFAPNEALEASVAALNVALRRQAVVECRLGAVGGDDAYMVVRAGLAPNEALFAGVGGCSGPSIRRKDAKCVEAHKDPNHRRYKAGYAGDRFEQLPILSPTCISGTSCQGKRQAVLNAPRTQLVRRRRRRPFIAPLDVRAPVGLAFSLSSFGRDQPSAILVARRGDGRDGLPRVQDEENQRGWVRQVR